MNIKTLFSLLFVFTFSLLELNAQTPQVVLRLDWGARDDQAGFRRAPEANYGPEAFVLKDQRLILLDAPQNKLKIFQNNKLLKSINIVPFADDFDWADENNFVVLAQNQLFFYRNGRLNNYFKPNSPLQIIETVHWLNSREVQLQFSDQTTAWFSYGQNRLQKVVTEKNGLSARPVKIKKLDEATVQISVDSAGSKILNLGPQQVASVRYLGRDGQNRMYFNFEFFEQQVPLRIRREIHVFDADFSLLLKLNVPVNNFTEIFRDWYIDPSARFYQMFSDRQGIKIVKWNLASLFDKANPPLLKYPQPYFEGRHYNFLPPSNAEQQKSAQLTKVTDFEDYPQIMPSEALNIADQYVQLKWTATSANITNGVITDAYGNQVRTPDWVKVGQNQQVPYKWGGFESLEAFVYGIEIDKYAGDNYTDDGGTPSAVGVDCSGFVSRCWNLPRHYATSMMDDGITLPYTSWSQTEPGDAVHKVGHVRMVVKQNSNGSLTVVESSGRDWRVSYRTYYYSSLSNYTPRYYVNRQGAPGNIPQPRIDLISIDDQLKVNWSLEGLENVSSVRLYFSTDGNSWGSGIAVPKDTTSWSVPVSDRQVIFVKIRSFSSGTLQNPSVPSDIYGAFRKDGKVKVLIVDGFDRTSATSGRWSQIYHPFVVSWGKSLVRAGIAFETTTNEMVKKGKVQLKDYPAVFYLLGDESYHDATFDRDEQALVKDYLQNGGRLFVSGSEVGYDLAGLGSSYDQAFFKDYLKAVYVKDNAGSNEVEGVADTPFAGLTLAFDNGLYGTYAVPYPDAITPTGGAKQALKYSNGQGAAVYFEGVFAEGGKPGKLVYLGFPFETIYTESQRDSLMRRIVRFFELDQLSALGQVANVLPERFELLGNFPNPFNNSTMIRFKLPAPGHVQLLVFNTLGQRVWQHRYSFSSGGRHRILFNGNRFPSGLYFYQVIFQGQKRTFRAKGKMLLVK